MRRPAGIRAQLVVAMLAVAVVASAGSMLLANRGIHHEIDDVARERVAADAHHAAAMAAEGWGTAVDPSADAVRDLARYAEDHQLTITLTPVAHRSGSPLAVHPDGTTSPARAPAAKPVATIAITATGRRVATLRAWPKGDLLDAQQRTISATLDRQHTLGALVAALFALVIALLLAARIAAPLARLASAAGEIADGDLEQPIPALGPLESRAIAEALERLRSGLLDEDRLRRTGFADLAHELRAPVTNIRARLEAAQDGVLPLDDGVDSMHAEALRLCALLDQLSMLADAERPAALTHHVRVDLADVVGTQVELHRAAFAHEGIELDAETAGAAPVPGDAGQLAQVVRNLLDNALAYTGRGGRVQVTVGTSSDGSGVDLRVTDTGIGIAPEDLANVTRRFWRGDAARARTRHGSGVGMAIVDEIVRSHGGSLAIDSSPGVGTTVTVHLPDRAGDGRARRHPALARNGTSP